MVLALSCTPSVVVVPEREPLPPVAIGVNEDQTRFCVDEQNLRLLYKREKILLDYTEVLKLQIKRCE